MISVLCLLTFLILGFPCWGTAQTISEESETTAEENLEEKVDTFHKKVSESILNSASYFDDFFSDDRSLMENNQTRLMARPGIGYERDGSLESRLRMSLRLRLPKTENRLNLLFTSNIDDEDDPGSSPLDRPSDRYNQAENNNFHGGIQYIYKATKRQNIRISGGVRASSRPQIYGGIRYRFFRPMENWDFRFIQRARWYSRNKWEFKSTMDFDRELSKSYLFRLTTDWAWYENEDNGFTYGSSLSLNQFLSPRRAVKYECSTRFESRPSHRITNTVFKVAYRQRIWRNWFLYEISPQIAFPRDNDFKITPGISLQFEIEFGYVDKHKDDPSPIF